jgi:hypothetical protein
LTNSSESHKRLIRPRWSLEGDAPTAKSLADSGW